MALPEHADEDDARPKRSRFWATSPARGASPYSPRRRSISRSVAQLSGSLAAVNATMRQRSTRPVLLSVAASLAIAIVLALHAIAEVMRTHTRIVDPNTINVQVILDDAIGRPAYPFSFFTGKTASRFSSGRVRYTILHVNSRKGTFDFEGKVEVKAPCIFTTKFVRQQTMAFRQARLPHCKFFLVGDEFCDQTTWMKAVQAQHRAPVDFRQYFGATNTPKGNRSASAEPNFVDSSYLPLGPRTDFWDVFGKLRQRHKTPLPPAERGYVFNAIYSEDTSQSRQVLSTVLHGSNMRLAEIGRSMIRIAPKWSASLSSAHLSTISYAQVLLDSAFTLSPAGHHPECYRVFEAIEAGSIPVVALDMDYRAHPCHDAMRPLVEDPGSGLVMVQHWDELPEILTALVADPAGLLDRQRNMTEWYGRFMRRRVKAMENRLLGVTPDEPPMEDNPAHP